MKQGSIALLWAASGLSACAGLSAETIRHHPRINLETLQPQVVEASGALRPSWIEHLERGAVDFVPFSGQSMAPTLEVARAQAQRDLYAAVSSFISVDVSSSFESKESYSNANGRESSSVDVHELVRSQTAAQLKEVKIDEIYWEKVQTSPLLPDATQYRYFTYARVQKAEILRARLQKQAQRQQGTGRRVLVVLPFRGPAAEAATIQDGVVEELARRLQGIPTIAVSDPELVKSLLAGERGRSEAVALETVDDALMPDWVLAGSYQLQGGRLRVSYSLRGPGGTTEVGTVEDQLEHLYQLEDRLLEALTQRLGAARSEAAPTTPSHQPRLPAIQAYAEAGRLYQAGQNEAALTTLREALTLDPDYARAYLRLGRVLERMGRYGDLDPEPPFTMDGLELCLPWARITRLSPELYLAGLTPPTGLAPLLGERVGEVLSAAQDGVTADNQPDPGVPLNPASAVGAYWQVYRLASLARDSVLRLEALIALADLAVRTDQLAAASALYQEALTSAEAQGLLHLRGLAKLGFGKVLKAQGQLTQAATWLTETLRERRELGDKPSVLEVLNELGGVLVDLGLYPTARVLYQEALRLADDLGNEYLRAVLGNNLGVLEASLGQTVRAQDRFLHALDRLNDLGEADGRIAAGLNAGWIVSQQGDLEAARQRFLDAQRIVAETGPLGREAELLLHRAASEAKAGQTEAALGALLRSWSIYARLGRTRDRLRVENELVVLVAADLGRRQLRGAERAQGVACLAQRADQISNGWARLGGGWGSNALAPFAAWSNAMWLGRLAELDGYFAAEFERGDRRWR